MDFILGFLFFKAPLSKKKLFFQIPELFGAVSLAFPLGLLFTCLLVSFLGV
jgi:hypothetical protein